MHPRSGITTYTNRIELGKTCIMSDASHRNRRYDPLDCSHLGPDDVQQFLQELFQVLHSAQVGQIDDLFQYIRSEASLEEVRSRISEILGSMSNLGAKDQR